MSAILQRFHQVANDALVNISAHCLPGAKIALVIYTPGKPEEDIILKDQGLDDNEVVSSLRRRGLSIDGDNAYKRDLCDARPMSATGGSLGSDVLGHGTGLSFKYRRAGIGAGISHRLPKQGAHQWRSISSESWKRTRGRLRAYQ